MRKINSRTRTPRGNIESTQFSVLPKFEISEETTLYTGETGIQAFPTLKVALTSFKCSTVYTYSSVTEIVCLCSSLAMSGDLLKACFLFLSVLGHNNNNKNNNNSILIISYIWEHGKFVPCALLVLTHLIFTRVLEVVPLPPLYWWRGWDIRRSHSFPKITELVNGRHGIWAYKV